MKLSLRPRAALISLSLVLLTGAAFACRKASPEEVAPAVVSSTYRTGELGHYIGHATRAQLWFARAHETMPPRPSVIEELDGKKLEALFRKINLKQVPNGPLAKCPGDHWYVFFDAQGNKLGRITFDDCTPRFDSADGKVMGGIKADL